MSKRSSRYSKQDPTRVFAALGDRTRLMLVVTLSDGKSRSIAQLTSAFSLTRQAVTKHLRVLEDAGIVQSERSGRESRYSYASGAIEDAKAYLDSVSRQWDEALGRLKAFVER